MTQDAVPYTKRGMYQSALAQKPAILPCDFSTKVGFCRCHKWPQALLFVDEVSTGIVPEFWIRVLDTSNESIVHRSAIPPSKLDHESDMIRGVQSRFHA